MLIAKTESLTINQFVPIHVFSIYHFSQLSAFRKVIIITGASSLIVGILAHFMKRKKITQDGRNKVFPLFKTSKDSIISKKQNGEIVSVVCSSKRSQAAHSWYSESNSKIIINGDRISIVTKNNDKNDNDSDVDYENDNENEPTVYQLKSMGIKTLEATIDCWSKLIESYELQECETSTIGLKSGDIEFLEAVKSILSKLKKIRDEAETTFRKSKRIFSKDEQLSDDSCDADSFESARDNVADLRDFDHYGNMFPNIENLALYKTGMTQFDQNLIKYRKIRSDIVHCCSDAEYLIKLYCIRLAFDYLFEKNEIRNWFLTVGNEIFCNLFDLVDKNSTDFQISLRKMIDFVENPINWPDMREELIPRGVHSFTFYDIVLDYIILDAFEDLDLPPYAVTTILNNQWLSNSFKECAMASAVWSALKIKRKRLKFTNGFMAHFYTLSEQISPLMAWGFLGPDSPLKEFCLYFKEQVFGLLVDLFSFEKCRFNTVEDLACDIFRIIEHRVMKIQAKFQGPKRS